MELQNSRHTIVLLYVLPIEISTRAFAFPDPLAVIGDALIRSLANKVDAEATADGLDDWTSVWREVAKRHPDPSLSVRLFGVGPIARDATTETRAAAPGGSLRPEAVCPRQT
jgi:hypothetical protein